MRQKVYAAAVACTSKIELEIHAGRHAGAGSGAPKENPATGECGGVLPALDNLRQLRGR
jgi:hypothetical protein